VIYDLIGHSVTLAFVIYFGLPLRQKVQTLQTTVTAQEKTIAAQAERMKAQSTVLQDFERLNKMMKQVIDTVDAPAMIERWQKYKSLVDALLDQQIQEFAEQGKQTLEQIQDAHHTLHVSTFRLLGFMLPFLPLELREALFETIGYPDDGHPSMKEPLQGLAREAQYVPLTGELAMEQVTQSEVMVQLKLALAGIQRANIFSTTQPQKEVQEPPAP
jgi:hypothetical protein